MAHDDRLFTLVCCAALLITGTVFIWTHHGSVRFEVGSLAEVNSASIEAPGPPTPDQVGAIADAGPAFAHATNEAPAMVPAVFEPPITAHNDSRNLTTDQMHGFLEAIIHNRSPKLDKWQLPTLAEVLVRRDRDGRLVVAAGTHRRYERAREAITALDGATVAAACENMERQLAMGLPGDGVFRTRVVEALDLLLAPELPEVEPDMVSRGADWGFADTGLDDLSPAQKHMLLMGLDNQRIVRSAFEDIREHLGGSPTTATPADPSNVESEVLIARRGQPRDEDQVTEP